jgi:tetratricopeptide (TPR) repeat protein
MFTWLKRLVGIPATASDWIDRGDYHLAEGNPAAAIAEFQKARKADTENPLPLCKLAEAALACESPEDAIAFCDEAIRLNADCGEAYYLRGIARRNVGAVGAARSDFSAALKLLPHHENAKAAMRTLDQIEATRE